MGALNDILKSAADIPTVKAAAWTVNSLDKSIGMIHNAPNDIAKHFHVANKLAAKIPLSIWDTLVPTNIAGAAMLSMTGGGDDAEYAGEKVATNLIKEAAIKGGVFAGVGSALATTQLALERKWSEIPKGILENGGIGFGLGVATEFIPRLYVKVMRKMANKEVIDKITPAFFKKVASKVSDELGRAFNMFGKNDEAYKMVVENENQKYIANYAGKYLTDAIDKNPEVVSKIGNSDNPFNATPQAFKNGIFTKDIRTLEKEYDLSPNDMQQLSNIRKARKEIEPFLNKTKQAYGEVSEGLKTYSKSALKLSQKERKISIATSQKLKNLFMHANSIDKISDKALNELDKTIDRFDAVKAKIENPLQTDISKAKASEILNNLLDKIQSDTDKVGNLVDKKAEATAKSATNLQDTHEEKLWNNIEKMWGGKKTPKEVKGIALSSREMYKMGDKAGAKLDKSVKDMNSIKERLDRLGIDKSRIKPGQRLSELFNKTQNKVDNFGNKLGNLVDKKANVTQNAANRFKDMSASKQYEIWNKMSTIAKKSDAAIAKIPERLTIPFDEYYSLAEHPLNSIKMRNLEPEDLIKKKVANFTREDTERHLTNTFSHSNAIMNIKKLDLNLAHRKINENYWAAKLSKEVNLPVSDLTSTLHGLPQAYSSQEQLQNVLERRLGDTPNAKNIARKILDKVYESAGMSEGLSDKEMEKLGGSPLFMQDNPMLKYSHDKTMSPVYGHLTGETPQIANWLDKLSVGIKRFRVGLLPTYHMFSETKSSMFAGIPLKEVADTLRLNKANFNKFMLNTYTETKDALDAKGVPFMTYFGRPVTFSKEEGGKIAKIVLGNKYMKFNEDLLWGKMYPAYKLLAAKHVAEDLTANLIDPKTAEYRLNMVNAFFGGLPELALRLPTETKTALRNLIFSPDWGLSLIKQMGYAAHGQDVHAVRYYTNMLAYNIFIRQAFQIFTGQPNSLTQLQHEHTPESLYSTTANMAGTPVKINVLGYEKEYPDLIYDPLKTLFESGIDAAAHKFMYRAGSKLGVLPHIAYSWGEWNKGNKSILNLLTPVMPFAVSTIMEKPTVSSILPSLLSSGLGVSATSEKGTKTLVNMVLSPEPFNSKALDASFNAIGDVYTSKAYKNPRRDVQSAVVRDIVDKIDYYYPDELAKNIYEYEQHPSKGLYNHIENMQANFESQYKKLFFNSGLMRAQFTPKEKKMLLIVKPFFKWLTVRKEIRTMVKKKIDGLKKGR